MNNLTEQDVNTLLECVDAWVTADQSQRMLAGLFVGALSYDKSKDEGSAKKAFDSMTEDSAKVKKNREEIAIFLKAKLLTLRDSIQAEELAKSIGEQNGRQ